MKAPEIHSRAMMKIAGILGVEALQIGRMVILQKRRFDSLTANRLVPTCFSLGKKESCGGPLTEPPRWRRIYSRRGDGKAEKKMRQVRSWIVSLAHDMSGRISR